ncbi:MAG: DUF4202 family protein [Thermoanaerobaculia bacterium]
MLEELAVFSRSAAQDAGRAALGAEFPTVFVHFELSGSEDALPGLRASDWLRRDFDTWAFDCAIDELASTLVVDDDTGIDTTAFALQVLTRCQRHVDRRNQHSQSQLFARVLRRHRELHDLSKPLVRADYNHALDVREWLLRLDRNASFALQLAALFHDIERLASEADVRVEHLAANYQTFKDAHARRGAEMTDAVLAEAGVDARTRDRVAELVMAHERPSADAELALLNDADALSFFSLNSSGYADYFGPEQTQKKVAYTWNRMSTHAREKLRGVRLRDDVRAMLKEV